MERGSTTRVGKLHRPCDTRIFLLITLCQGLRVPSLSKDSILSKADITEPKAATRFRQRLQPGYRAI
ncbi:hypothetical protein OK016_29170 [Vibrio chagasii]|nr:hypothetical protein [Vibrio chagasii]